MTFDRVKKGLQSFVLAVFPRIDYFALYSAVVVAQNADDTLELQPDDARIPGLSSIGIRYGTPGTTVKVQAGTRVLVGFNGGHPELPYAAIWDSTGVVVQLNLAAQTIVLNGGSAGVGRVGDQVQVTFDSVAAGKLSCAAAPGPCSLTTGSFTVNGTITAGSSTVKSG